MKSKSTLKLVLSLFFAAILNKSVNAQITLLQDYKNNYSAPIGTFQGIKFKEGGFSGMYPIPNTNGKEFWVISDRGMNVDCINANPSTCRPTYDKMFGLPTYAPKIFRVKLNGDSVQILKTISIKRPGGTDATGIMNPTGFGSTATEQASTDTVLNCSKFNLKIAAKDIWGIDAEGIVVDKDGNFWISEEGGPTIWKLDPNGVVISRFTPYAKKVGAQAQDIYIDSCFAYRKNNRGFEGLSITPNGKIYAIIQSPILYPTTTIGEATRVHRMIEIDPITNTSKMYVYLNDGPVGVGSNQIRFRDWKIGDMAAVNDSTFLLIDHAVRGTTDRKSVYLININGATAVNSGLYGGKTLEALVDSTGLAANGVKPVKKKLFIDLLANGWAAALDKPEGLAIVNDSTIAVCNDNDFGQVCTAQDGIPVPTSTLCHIYTYGLKGSNKLSGFRNGPSTGALPSSSATPYLEGVASGVKTNALITAGDSVKGGYRMAGLADGLGAYDNGNGTFTVLVNHEMGNTLGAVHAHGSKGAFVSKWVINKSDLAVTSGSDLVTKVKLWRTNTYKDTTTAFNRFCSADLPPVSAFYNAATGLGTQERIFMNGEESGSEGRAFGHIVTGANAGTTYELPYLGKFSWENSIASPYASNKTVVVGTDDATPGQVYFYIGTKTNSGTEIEKAGLNGGKLFGVKVSGLTAESSSSIPSAGTAFTLFDLGQVQNTTGAALNTASNTAGVTTFLRPEDGAWDPSNPNDFYFATTNSFTAPSRLWRLRFTDIANPENGGTITAVLDGTEGPKMIDNIGFDKFGHIMLQEDVGNQAHNGKIWQYTIATDAVKLIAQHDPNRFILGGSSYLTQDEESSGIIDVQDILGAGMFVYADQAHYSIPGDIVEGGQLLTLYNPDTYNSSKGALPSSSNTPYLEGVASGVKTDALMTVGDSVKGGYRLAGLLDGLGAYDNNDGTFTILANHEMSSTLGAVHAHGSKGAFVSKWVVNKTNLSVASGSDLITKVKLWRTSTYKDTTTAFNRFCAGDLPLGSAFYNAATGLGTTERIFMNGEEAGSEGRAFGHIVTGANAGTTYELPYLGKFSWENAIASPYTSNKTIVAGTDDATPGQVYFYIGTKTNSGSEIDKAGLSGGKLFGVKVSGLTAESSSSIPSAGTAFTLFDLGQVQNTTGAALNTASNTAGVTAFLRPEDGAWDPSNPNDFYFVTTNSFTAPSRLWRLRFTDIANPENGGTITAVLDGTEGPKMMDNMVIDKFGHIMIQEDPGNQSYIAKIWQYTIATDVVKEIARHDANRFVLGGSSYLTQDEESSGIVDMQDILGPGMFVYADQAHYSLPGDLVEGGQLLTLYNPDTYNSVKGALPSSSATPYLEGVASGVKTNALITAGDSVKGGYRMAGLADGLGAYDNGNGTFTVLVNHEMGNTLGAVHAHGSKGAFVSKWVINKSDLAVTSGSDLVTKVKLWRTNTYKDTTTAFNRFCSADLPPVSAFYNAATGLGTQERIFMNGEESGSEGRAFGHIVTGANAGTTYELPYLGKFSWENSIASPYASNKTVVVGTDDATPGQVYFYIGTKTNSGTEIEKAGLNGGKLFGVKVSGLTAESSSSIPSAGTAFTLFDLGQVQNTTGAALNTASNTAGVTTFLRPEDGAWDPSNPNDFYFATTNSFTAPSRLWRLRFTDIANPENGGTITAVLDGTEGPKMIDNIGFDKFGHIMLQEDVGNQAHNGKIWQYTIATDAVKLIAQHDPNRFILGGSSYLTQDEESSGIIDVQDILGAGMFVYADQAHYSIPGDIVEGGQLLTLYNPDTYNSSKGALPSSSNTPYLEGVASGVKTDALMTVGDSVKGGYRLAGLLDGLGAYDNNDGTFTILANHEMSSTLGAVHAHGSKGAFVSKWVVNKTNLSVASGSDLITKVKLWRTSTYKDTTTAFNRFCAGDLPLGSAFYNAATGLGTTERIFMNGEEAGSEGRAFGHIVTGANAGTTYELPYLGKFSWENAIASPYTSNKTIVAGTDDATPGQVYFYIGTKTNSGSEIDKAGLSGGKLFGVKVSGLTAESSSSIPSAGTAFTLFDLGQVQNTTGAALNTASNTAGVTAFLRPEDGAWDPSNPNDFYFVTTNSFTAPSRLWRLRFTDIANPENGGTITAVLDGTEGPKMMDNMVIDKFGHIMIQEDPGNQSYIAKIWQYTIATDVVKEIARHDANRFVLGGSSYLTQDEESSGIVDMQDILGPGMFVYADQAHYSLPGDLVEGGQLLTLYNPDTYNSNPEVSVKGNKVNIAKGDITPSTADNTDFGTLNTNTSVNKTFVVKNAGPGALILNGISFTGTNASEFSVVGAPTYPASINANDSLIVTVKFAPLADGLRKATATINNNDADENSYDFALQGTAVSPEINIQGNSVTIASGSTTPNVGNNTDFGTVNKGSNATKSFVIQNTGAGSLTITSFNFTGANASEFTLVGQPSLPLVIAANGSQTITVQFAPTAAGLRTATLNIASNDADEAAYTFALQGNGNTSSIKQVVYTNSYVIAPNPFELISNVKIDLVSAAKVSIEVFNLLGERVELVVNGVFTAGQYNFSFGNNQNNYPTGIYLVKVVIDGKVSTTKVIKNN